MGRRPPSEALNTSGSCKPDARTARAVGLPSPRNPAEKLIDKQQALVVSLRLMESQGLCHLYEGPYEAESDMNARPSVPAILDHKKFQVSCKAADANRFCVGTDTLSVAVSQRILRDTGEEMWESVGVYAKEDEDGSLVIRVLVFNPDWEEPL